MDLVLAVRVEAAQEARVQSHARDVQQHIEGRLRQLGRLNPGERFEQYRDYGWSGALHPDDRERTIGRWQAAVAARGRFEDEHRVMTASGEYRTYSVRAIPLLGAGGELLEWVGLHTDVTPLREAEAALKAINADLSNFNALLLDSAG